MPEWRKLLEAEDHDIGGRAGVLWKCVLPLKWVPHDASHLERAGGPHIRGLHLPDFGKCGAFAVPYRTQSALLTEGLPIYPH